MKKHSSYNRLSNALTSGIILGGATILPAQVSYVSGTLTQDFDSLATASAITANAFDFVDNLTLPGWHALSATTAFNGSLETFSLSGTVTNRADQYGISDNSTNSGDLYSSGTLGSTDRSLGAVGSSGSDYFIAYSVINDTGLPLKNFTVKYDGEQWRRGGNATERPESIYVFYRIGGTALDNSGTWTNIPELTFTSPNVTPNGSATGLDGNAIENRIANITRTVTAAVPAGETLWILFADADDFGSDHAMTIDNFSFTAETNTGGNISIGAGNTFTATSFGGNAFTANDNAVFDGVSTEVTLSGSVVAAGLTFTTDGYTLSGTASDSIWVNGTINVAEGVTDTISGVLVGDTGLVKTGLGTLILSGTNTFTGVVSVAGTLNIPSDDALGNSANSISLAGTLATNASTLTLGAGRTISGSGTFELPPSGILNIDGPTSLGPVALAGATTLNLAGETNSIGSLTSSEPIDINITGGALSLGSSLTLSQASGTTTISGPITTAGDRNVFVNGGSLKPTGSVTLGGRIIKTGAGTLDLSSANVTTTTPTSGGYRLGIQGSSPIDGGTIIVADGAALGNLQLQFNSGTLEVVGDLTSATGLSIGGRAETSGPSVPEPTITGGNLTLSGNNGFFSAFGASGDILFNVNNTTTLSGYFAPTSASLVTTEWVGVGGTGTLVLSGDATRLTDWFIATDSVTLVLDGSLGGARLLIEAGATLSGSGVFTGSSPWEDADTSTTNALTQPATPIYLESTSNIFGTLAPSGALTLRGSTTLQSGSSTVLQINGTTRGTQYDALTVEVPAGSGFSYSLTFGGTLTLDFGASVKNGDYNLFTVGEGTTFAGAFDSVSLTGAHTGSLTKSGSVWSGTSGATFSFDESTGVLTVTGGAPVTSALEDWRLANFESIDNSGAGADGADSDKDGISNLIEYATGTNPKVANASVVTVGTKDNAGEFLTLSFTRINDPALTYTILGGNDLATGLTSTGTTYPGSAADTVVYEDSVSLTTPGVRRFLSLQVSYGTP